jgi:PAS domain S-box-containing protein
MSEKPESRQSVLVVDDDPDILTALKDLLEFEGYQVDRAGSCRDAVACIERSRYHAVLLDLGLPDGNGLSVLQTVQEANPALPVIVLTASTSSEISSRSLSGGAFAYLAKPYHRDVLRATLRRAIGTQALVQEVAGAVSALTESEDRFRSVVQSAPDAIIVADEHGYIVSWNGAASSMFLYEASEILGKPLTEIMPMRYREAHELGMERVRSTGRSKVIGHVVRLHGLRKDRTEFPIELSLATWQARSGSYFSGIIRDVSERMRSEELLRDLQERFRLVTQIMGEVFWLTDPEKNTMLYVSPSYERIWGRSCEELYRSPRSWLEGIHPDDRSRILYAATTKQTNGTYAEEYRIVRPDGTIRWIRDRAIPVKDAHGLIVKVAGIAEDITESRHHTG